MFKKTTAVPTHGDANNFSIKYIYAKLLVIRKSIDGIFDNVLNDCTPDAASAFLECLSEKSVQEILSSGTWETDEFSDSIDCYAAETIKSLKDQSMISEIWEDLFYQEESGDPREIDIAEKTSGLYSPTDDPQVIKAMQKVRSWCWDSISTDTAYPWITSELFEEKKCSS